MSKGPGRTGLPARIRAAALFLPMVLVAALIVLDDLVLHPALGAPASTLAAIVIGATGIFAFSAGIFAQLDALHRRELAQRQRLTELARDLEDRRRQLQALNAAGMTLSAELDTESVLQKIVDAAREVAEARYAALGIFDHEGIVSQFITSGISSELRARIGALPRGRGLLGLLQREPRPIRVPEIAAHPASVGFPPEHPPMRSFLGAPILWRGRAVGNLYLTEKIGAEDFSGEDEEALLTLAAQAAIAIENARLYEQAARVSVLEERDRIGMDLHDGAMQSLYGVGLLLEDAGERVRSEPDEATRALHRAVDLLNGTIADLRGYVLGLRPVRDADRPLRESLPALAQQLGQNALLAVDVAIDADAEDDLGPAEREALFYVAADALGNIARHARASHARVRLARRDRALVLEIADDGVGFAEARPGQGHGLRNMRERAFAIGARLQIDAAPGSGTRIRLELPVPGEVPA
ncbi:MAG TPA: GAF domain-containing sensor histidine kinase [Candidatus Limnocylindrales bacterium]|nr:GAF domain-containing sensor histidine kinase [Candidatus Limnocylindrales bacterium]